MYTTKNNILNITSISKRNTSPLSAAIVIYCISKPLNGHANAMREIYHIILAQKPRYSAWLLVSNGGMVKATRITEQYRLWGGLKKSGISLPAGDLTKEYAIHSKNNETQYFGAIHLINPEFSEISNFMSSHSSSHLVLSDDWKSIKQLISNGWRYDR
ncbi:hypothetical protein GIB19_27675 [Pseudomonas sp. ITEM 17296]|uniref:hypothetical protein n=1 Tax=Pseudomonas sp. ITEM 17296 TaxID=2790281 RepID=UPI0012FD9B31|nr:hypothetical protein [Pseudomonas sp. ITEM 17296]MDE4540990.1 hypothetical protein [Pseudomonas sp. ITEM 17296]